MFESYQEFLVNSAPHISLFGFIFNIAMTAIMSVVLGWTYTRYGDSLSNRRIFARNFLALAMTTMLIITIVKSSLALSLGLVGALSIIRFRAAIKEPEELTYLYLAISLGLGYGANQVVITTVAFLLIATIIIFKRKMSSKEIENSNLHLTIQKKYQDDNDLKTIIEILKTKCVCVNLKRYDHLEESLEASFLVTYDNYDMLLETKALLIEMDSSVQITFIDNKGLI